MAEVVVVGKKSRDGVGVLWRCVDVWTGCQGSANIHQKGKYSANIHQNYCFRRAEHSAAPLQHIHVTDRSQGCEQLTGGVR